MNRRGRRNGRRIPRPAPLGGASGLGPALEALERRRLLATIVVTSLGDASSPMVDGQVTLREAIASVNAGANANADVAAVGAYGTNDQIVFNGLSGTIALAGDLPALSRSVLVDGRTGAGFAEAPVITVSGNGVANRIFAIRGPDVAIRSLALVGALGDGINVSGPMATGALIAGNHIGVNAAGNTAVPNRGDGIEISGGARNASIGGAVGVNDFTNRNVIAGNLGDNVNLDGASGVLVRGNFIGSNRSGTVALGGGGATVGGMVVDGDGIQIRGGSGNTIGGSGFGAGNLISGNGSDGIEINGGASGTLIVGNRIGTNAAGSSALANGFNGVQIRGDSRNNTVGGVNASPFVPNVGNLVSGNLGDGIHIEGASSTGNLVLGNLVGTDLNGAIELGNVGAGIGLNGAPLNTVGGPASGAGNLVSGNGGDGLLIGGDGAFRNLAQGNRIGTNALGTLAIPNVEDGVAINGGRSNTIGGAAAGAGNLISGNASDGIELGGGSSGNLVQGNRIGTNALGTLAIGNLENGVRLDAGLSTVGGSVQFNGAVSNTIGGVNAADGVRTAGNLISGNGRNGVILLGRGTSGNVVEGNFVGTAAGGSSALGNTLHGILLRGAAGNFIGQPNVGLQGGALRSGNLVSGNGEDGIRLTTFENDGGEVLSVSAGNVVSGNFVGTDASGASAVGNAGAGVAIVGAANGVGDVSGNTIGGVNADGVLTAGNLVSGNARVGLLISGASAVGNVAFGNYVGTDAGGGAAVPNGRIPMSGAGPGILIDQGASSNSIGGVNADPSVLTAGNLVSGNAGIGVSIRSASTTGNLLLGNFIGLDASGVAIVANGLDGVAIASAVDNRIGGGSFGSRNVIAGNLVDGVAIGQGASRNLVAGNFVGTIADGTAVLGNGDAGVLVNDASDNTIGGINPNSAGNVISGNLDGVRIVDVLSTPALPTTGNLVTGNFIGTDLGGSLALGNRNDGVRIVASSGNTVGGTIPGSANLISANLGNGVALGGDSNPASGNLIAGNLIGTNVDGNLDLGNGGAGVLLAPGATGNTVGGANPADGSMIAGNLVSGNAGAGVRIVGPGASANLVSGNRIGTASGGTTALPNDGPGVRIEGSSGNTVGGAAGNLVSGNGAEGVRIEGEGASGNLVAGNFIGTDVGGGAAVPNLGDGVAIVSGASNNTVGGSNATGLNLVSGNAGAGIRIDGLGNLVAGNFVGTNLDGTLAIGNEVGVLLDSGASGNTIGAGNVVSGNRLEGVRIGPGGSGNLISGNFVGTGPAGNVDVGNAGDGIRVDGAGSSQILGNVVAGNGGIGVAIAGASTGSLVQSNFIGTNAGGTAAVPNIGGGLALLDAGDVTVGGAGAGLGNIVSGNAGIGILLSGAATTRNVIAGNLVGTNAEGTAAIGNDDGIVVAALASDNTLGGNSTPAGNLVSGNRNDGVVIQGGASGNLVSGNLIGSNAAGTAAIGNGGSGVRISDSPNNIIGMDTAIPDPSVPPNTAIRGRVNLISGNAAFGIAIAGAGASGNIVAGNRIGTDLGGTASLGGQRTGVVILNAPGNSVSAGNLIAGHVEDGLQLIGPGATGNAIDSNFIGTDNQGRAGLGNDRGVLVDAADGNFIGGNVISGNRGDGLVILNDAEGNIASGNLLGLTLGGVSRGNGSSGLLIVGAPNNTIRGNVAGGNGGFGMAVAGTSGNVLSGNYIGTDGAGSSARPNGLDGVMILAASDNILSSNVISSSGLYGVELRAGASGNVLIGNRIGTDAAGIAALPNTIDGVQIDGGVSNRLEGNLISGNAGDGVKIINGDSRGNLLIDNFLGTGPTGATALPNGGSGVLIAGSPGNVVQNSVASGNLGFGVAVAGASGNVITGSFIGTDLGGGNTLSNGLYGVFLLNAPNNLVTGSVIAGNGTRLAGGNVRIEGAGSTGNVLTGNRIGTDADGTRSLDPRLSEVRTGGGPLPADGVPALGDRVTFDPCNDGVVLVDGASDNIIGGLAMADRNLISGNRIGVYIRGQAARNVVLGNLVGTNAEGTAALPNSEGVIVQNSSANTIGGNALGARNIVSGNFGAGVRLTSIAFEEPIAPAQANLVAGNYIGTNVNGDAALGNRQGVSIYGASNNSIGLGSFANAEGGGNLISGNREVGVQILNADTVNASTLQTPGGPVIVPSAATVGAVSSGNVVAGNRVGTNAAGTGRLSNVQGVVIADAPGNAVVDNLISGNSQVGLTLFAFNTINTFVGANRIGPDLAGNVGPLGNGFADPGGLGSGVFLNQVVNGGNTIAPDNDIRGNSGVQTRSRAISAGPFVDRVALGNASDGSINRLDVVFNGYLARIASRTLNPANYVIEDLSAGGNVALDSLSYDEVARTVSLTTASPLLPGRSYRLTVVGQPIGGLASRASAAAPFAFLDGNLDGNAGDNYTQTIVIPASPATSSAALLARSPSPDLIDALADVNELP